MDMNQQLSEHFNRREFSCKGCRWKSTCPHGHGYGQGLATVDAGLLILLEDTRTNFGRPMTITSGQRCPQHNESQNGAKRSQHLLGTAADIQVAGVPALEVYKYLDAFHEGGLGRYGSFTHVDVRNARRRF